MPIPKPNGGENEEEFINRCMSDSNMQEYPTSQRLAICHQQWDGKGEGIMEMEQKTFSEIELKADKEGGFTARIATLNVVDKDGDVTLPGAFPIGKTILISAYQHSSWGDALPVGKGVIHEKGDDVLVEGQLNLKTDTGRDHYETLKFAPELSEWSYGFIVEEFEENTEFEGQQVSRILKKVDVFEASPVLRGAGVGTATLAIKANNQGMTFTAEAEAVLAAVDDLVTRAKSLADLRRKEGRTLSAANIARIRKLAERIKEIEADITELMLVADPPDDDGKARQGEIDRLLLECEATKSKMLGVEM